MDPDTAYANAPFIPGAEAFPPRWAAAAAAFRTRLGARARLDLGYGPAPRQRFDLFLPEAPPRGLMLFLHGGYWRAFGRADWSHLAAGAVARGWACAVPSYTLAPEARIAAITAESVAAFDAAAALVAEGPVVAAGHSAGGHLAARLACTDLAPRAVGRLRRVLPISPLADLRPLLATTMNADLRLDPAEAAAESPVLRQRRTGVAVDVRVGADERPAFLDQAHWLGTAWGVPVTVQPGRHHFDVIEGLERPDGVLTAALLDGL